MARKKKKKNRSKKVKKALPSLSLPKETRKTIGAVIMFVLAFIILLSFWQKAGIFGEKFVSFFSFLIGNTIYTLPLFLLLAGAVFLNTDYRKFLAPIALAISITILGISGILASLEPHLREGGVLGYILSQPLLRVFGFLVTQIIFCTLILIGIVIFRQLIKPQFAEEKKELEERKEEGVFTRVLGKAKSVPKFKIKEITPLPNDKASKPQTTAPSLELEVGKVAQKPITSKYQLPPLDLLEEDKETPTAGDTRAMAMVIKKTLENFDIPVEMAEINIGPTVTQYTFKPAEGIKLSKITALSNNLALALAAHPIRIEAPIPGRSLVGIEVPNTARARIRLRNLLSDSIFQNSSFQLPLALGKDVSGGPAFADLAKMPHLLVAGATGTGKTIFLNSLIISLLYQKGPEMLRLVLVDPKRVEFTAYNKIPHLLGPVIHDAQTTVYSLNWLISEMGRRFDILAEEKVRDITSYNEKVLKEGNGLMPYIIFIVDELADLIMAKGKEVEAGIVRLAQLARAVGIHLVLATQRPSVEVITGLIKANITSRVSFQVASQVDSRTVLDMAGAERLLGLGDLLFLSASTVKPKRVQGPYVSEKEVKKVVKWIEEKNEGILAENGLGQELKDYLEKAAQEGIGSRGEGKEDFFAKDPLYPEAKRLVIEKGKASASFLQRKLRIGYARAARLLDALEERGVVGPADGAKPRKVFIGEEDFGEDYNEDIV
jgi:S-DNA-T family DNA segregation ATPase FtsK/SpoIIIE